MKTLQSLLMEQTEKYAGSYDVFVLKGFSNGILKEMAAKMPHLNGVLPLDKKGLLDLAKIMQSGESLISKLAKASGGKPRLLDMESFIEIACNSDVDATGKRFVVIENNLLNEYPNQSNCTAEDYEDAIHADKEIPDDSPFYKFYSNATRFKELTLVQYIGGFDDELGAVRTIPLFSAAEPELEKATERGQAKDEDFRFQQHSKEYLELKIGIYNGKHVESLRAGVEDSIRQQKGAYEELRLLAGALKDMETEAKFYLHESKLNDAPRPELAALLLKYWKSEAFRMLNIYSRPGRRQRTDGCEPGGSDRRSDSAV